MKKTAVFILISLASYLTWLAWNPPLQSQQNSRIELPLPDIQAIDAGAWRVLTRRMVWKKAVEDMQKRLHEANLFPQLIQKPEAVELHVFDDARVFKTHEEAIIAEADWKKLNIESSIFSTHDKAGNEQFMIGLGRFYLTEYAELIQQQLKQSQLAYHYERRTVTIPSFHFVFPSMNKDEAEIMWNRLQNIGLAGPVIMQENEFQQLYPNSAKQAL